MNRPNWIKWLWFGLFLIISIPLLFGVFKSCKKDNDYPKKNNETALDLSQYHYRYKTVNFSGEYGEVVYLPSESMFAFLDATEPYCSLNKNNHIECGEKGQDISTKMRDTNANMELRFKSSNRKQGTLRIRVRNK